jgi:AcrR family transcriptional regulator
MVMNHEPSRVERKRDARTSAILDEAMTILENEGVDALTLGRLARSLDLVPAALYRYFESKDALLSALQRRAISLVHTRVREELASFERRPERLPPAAASLAKILAVARLYLSLRRTEPQTHFLLAVLMGDPRPLLSEEEGKRTAPLLLALLGDVEALFREAHEARALGKGDSFDRTLAFWAILQGTLALDKARRIAPRLPSTSDVAIEAITAMLAGWGAHDAVLRRGKRGKRKKN